MGFAKNRQMEQDDYGYSMHADMSVCAACVAEPDLAPFVEARLTAEHCDFCGCEASAPIAVDAEDVLKHIGASLQLEFEDASALPHDSESSTGYFGETFFTDEAIEYAEAEIENPRFAAFVSDAYSDKHWCVRDPFGNREHETLADIWTAFRHFAESTPDFDPDAGLLIPDEPGTSHTVAQDVLHNVARIVDEVGLMRELAAGTRLLRGRVHEPGTAYTAAQLGTPPANLAGDGRMNRAGTALFYGAEETDTVYAELVELRRGAGKTVTVGTFETTERAWVIDLSHLPDYAGIFDEARQHQRQSILFLRGFRSDISAPARSSSTPKPEYRPTQIIAEYLLANTRDLTGDTFRGLAYPSAPRPEGENIALAVAHEDCIDPSAATTPGRLQLRLVSSAVRRPVR